MLGRTIISLLVCLSCSAQLPVIPVITAASVQGFTEPNWASVANLYIELFGNSTTNYDSVNNVWIDISGKANSFKRQNTQITYTHTGPNGFYAANFSASTGDWLQCTNSPNSNAPNTIIVVATASTSTTNAVLYDSADVSHVTKLQISTNSTASFTAAAAVTIPNFINNGAWEIFSAVSDGVNTVVRTNGVNMKTITTAGSISWGQPMLGRAESGSVNAYTGAYTAVLVYGRALHTNELAWVEQELSLKYNLGLTVTSNGFDPGSVWADRVVLNSGSYPSANTKVAQTALCEGLMSDGIYNLIGDMTSCPTDSVIAVTTPIINAFSSADEPWVNHNFVSGDLTVNGLTGNTTTKYMDTGVAGATMLTANNTALFSYIIHVNTASGVDIAVSNSGNTQDILLIGDDGGTAFWDSYNATAGQGRISVATKGAGYYCGSRTSSSSTVLYFANQSNAHASIASAATSGGSLPGGTVFAFAENNNGTPAVWCDNEIGAVGICLGLTSGQSSSLFNRLVTFRTAEGGTNP